MPARPLVLLALFASAVAAAQTVPNPDFYYGSVIESFRKHDPQMVHFSLLYKGEASEELDVILVRGGRYRDYWPGAASITELFDGDLLGVFLVSRADPALAYELAIEQDLTGRIAVERDEPGEITIRPFNAYGISGMRRKYFYQTSSKQLPAKRNFWPNGLEHADLRNGQVMLWGYFPDRQRFPNPPSLAVVPEVDGFRQIDAPKYTSSYRSGEVELLTFGDDCALVETRDNFNPRSVRCSSQSSERVRYTAPSTDFAGFAAARPEKVKRGWTKKGATFNETIGPYQIEGDGLWFGLTFYDGEGHTGVGGFGYFDSRGRQFEMRYPPELANWSVSALLVQERVIWLGLEGRGEGQRDSGGLALWDRATQEIVRWPEAPRPLAIVNQGERLYMATDEGAAIFEDGEFTRYLLDVDRDGAYRLVKRELR